MRQAIRKTFKEESRKFVTQMSADEKITLGKKLRNVPTEQWSLTEHCMDRILQKNIYAFRKEIIDVLNHYEVLEYKKITVGSNSGERIIVRDLRKTNHNHNLNVVFDVTAKKVVSVWLNHIEDRHETLDFSIYNDKLEIV